MVAPTWITPGCVQFLENRKRFHTACADSGRSREVRLTRCRPENIGRSCMRHDESATTRIDNIRRTSPKVINLA
jgi:hypothetical protein